MSLPIRSFNSRFQLHVGSSLEAQRKSPEQVAEFREKNWGYFLPPCRPLVPERERLLKHFNLVVDQFWDVKDAKSGKFLLRPQAMKAVDLLRKRIEADCLSDPDGVGLYYTTGKNAAGVTTRRCVRGINSTEVLFSRRLLSLPGTYRYRLDLLYSSLLNACRQVHGLLC